MKYGKKLSCILLVLTLLMSIALPAVAADSYTITIDNQSEGYEYEVFQIFKGELQEDGTINVVWGNGIATEGLVEVLQGNAELGQLFADLPAEATASEVAEVLKDQSEDTLIAFAAAIEPYLIVDEVILIEGEWVFEENEDGYEYEVLKGYSAKVDDAGYYLIRHGEGSKVTGIPRYLLWVNKDVTISPKKNTVPQIEKSAESTESDLGDYVGDINRSEVVRLVPTHCTTIGAPIRYHLDVTLPENLDDYESYKLIIHDTLPAGITFNGWFDILRDQYGYYDEGTDPEIEYEPPRWRQENIETDHYTATSRVNEDGTTSLTVCIRDIKQYRDAEGNEIYSGGDVVSVCYFAELNENAVIGAPGNRNVAYLEYSNDPDAGADGSMGKTPETDHTMYTGELTINKTDADGNLLPGAAFKLDKIFEPYVPTEGDGYPAHYSEAQMAAMGIEFYFKEWMGPTQPHYIKEIKTIGPEEDITSFTFSGLCGTYRLTETVTPEGYNSIEPIHFAINIDHNGAVEITPLVLVPDSWVNEDYDDGNFYEFRPAEDGELDVEFSVDTSASGKIVLNVVNKSGTILPATGGVGTTIFYVLGSIMVVAAAVLLIAKKRMRATE